MLSSICLSPCPVQGSLCGSRPPLSRRVQVTAGHRDISVSTTQGQATPLWGLPAHGHAWGASQATAASTERSGIHVYTTSSPNGWKASVMLEELGLAYTVHKVDLQAGEQKSEEYLRINPVGKVPAIVDYEARPGGVTVFESGAILCYLADTKDPDHKLLPVEAAARGEVLSWVFLQTSGVVPTVQHTVAPLMFGTPSTKEELDRDLAELRKFLTILDRRLELGGGWLAAGQYTIADIAHFGMVLLLRHVFGLDLKSEYHNIFRWLERITNRRAVRKGMRVPEAGWLLNKRAREAALKALYDTAREYGVQVTR